MFNGTGQFVIHDASGDTASAIFIFASENGTITGWNPSLPPGGTPPAPSDQAQVAVSIPRAVFKGVTIASDGNNNFLFATDFHNGKVDVFDSNFAPVTLAAGAFTDKSIPAGFAPFNIQNLDGKLYVTYAKQDADRHDDVAGPGNGFVDVFDVHGKLIERVADHGPLNSPWGLAIAPDGFGKFGGDLLVGNFGDGHINAFSRSTGRNTARPTGRSRRPTASRWSSTGCGAYSSATASRPATRRRCSSRAGPDDEAHGLFGTLTPVTGKHGHDGDHDHDSDDDSAKVADFGGKTEHDSESPAPANVRQSQAQSANIVDSSSMTAFLGSNVGLLGGVRVSTAAIGGHGEIMAGLGSPIDSVFGFLDGRLDRDGIFVG